MPIKNTDLKNKLKGNIILGGDTLSTLSTPQVAKQGVEAMGSIIPQSTSKKQVLQSTKDKIENKQKLNLKEKKALVEEKRAETKVKKAAKAEQILRSDNVEFLDWLKDTSTNKFYAEVQKQEKALQNQQQYLKDIDSFLQGLTLKNKERQILFTHGFSKDELIIARDKIIKQIEKDNKELAPFLALLRKKEANDKATSQTIKAQQERINIGKSMLSGFKEVYQDGIISDEQIVKTKGGIVSLFNDPMANTPETRKYLLDSSFRNRIEKAYNISPIKEFGTNYAEFYHDGSNAIKKLLVEKQGQVAGAFNKDGKDITLVLGIEGTSHSDGYGLAKIAKYHPEAVDKLDNIISKGEFYKDEKGRLNIKYNDDIVGLRENWLGNETAPWIISSYNKKVETSKVINSASSITPSKENYSFTTQHNNIIPQNSKEVNPTSNKVFANEHIGGGLGGTLNGVETDENGNISFDPAKFALGFLTGAGGVAGIKRANKFLTDNPQFKQAFKDELAKTLSNGWENAKAKNPLLKTLETNSYIVPNEKGVSPEDVIKASQNLAKDDYHGINLKEQKSIKQVVEANSKITDTSIKAGEFAKPKGDSTYTKAWDSYERLVDRGFDKLEELVKNTVKKGADLPGGAVSKILNNFLDFESGGKAVGEVFQNYRELTYKNSSLSSKIYKGLSTLSNKNIKSLFHALFLE
ncbi:TPA: hypothetical protein RPW53_000301 [Campylobacter fetus subsp. venerealis]|nr:hypothetical protein [Campylobacter fetus subsp. venerealis]